MGRLNSLRQRLDEVEDVGVPTRVFDLFLRDFLSWLGRAEQDVEPDRASVKRWLLRDERDVLPVLGDVELSDGLLVEVHSADKRVVEPLDQLDTVNNELATGP